MGSAIFDSLRRAPFQNFLRDYGLGNGKNYSRIIVLTLSLLLSRYLRAQKAGLRVGVVLPSGLGGIVANAALFLCGRIPVNLNFTLGTEINQEIIKRANLEMVITASAMVQKIPDFPWPGNCILLDGVLREISSNRWQFFGTLLSVLLVPNWVRRKFKVPSSGEDETAILLFTSGSSGTPKAVPLSHRNILSNCNQLYGLELFKNRPKVLLNLPLFHSFGLSIGMIFSTLRGLNLVRAPSPLDHNLNLKIIREQRIEILLGTPTFLRGYLKKAKDNELISIKYVIAGAEKSPEKFRERWERTTDCQYLEGYGLTETSPAVSFNLPGEGKRSGSVGRLLEGIECRTLDPESGLENCHHKGGILCFRGPNVFAGYWMDPKRSTEVLDADGWFCTGDLGRLDEDGFLWIEGRVSRFSKIGGEMVPHGRIEEEIYNFLNLCISDGPQIVVTAVHDNQKGERLIVISSIEINGNELREGLKKKGVPNLWIPRDYLKVEEIPSLPTGKIDWEKVKSYLADKLA